MLAQSLGAFLMPQLPMQPFFVPGIFAVRQNRIAKAIFQLDDAIAIAGTDRRGNLAWFELLRRACKRLVHIIPGKITQIAPAAGKLPVLKCFGGELLEAGAGLQSFVEPVGLLVRGSEQMP